MKLFKKTLWLSAILATLSGVGAMVACSGFPLPGTGSSSTTSEVSSTVTESASSEAPLSSVVSSESSEATSSIESSKASEVASSIESSEASEELSSSESASNEESSSSSSVNDNDYAFMYRIRVQNVTGFGFAGVTVSLKDGDEIIAKKTTNTSGNANFLVSDLTEAGNYTIVVESTPAGYALPEEEQQTIALAGTEVEVILTPTGILEGDAPAGTYYQLGDVVYDFSITLSDNTTYTLSEILQEKDLVMLNFWATWCGPCQEEFPAMHNAALAYLDSVSVLAISTTDAKNAVADFKAKNSFDAFNMAAAGSGNLASMFAVSAIPHTVMIDRYGVVVYNEIGSMPSMSAFTVQFDKFIGEDYIPTVVGGASGGDVGGSGGAEDEPELVKPTVPYADVDKIRDVLTQETTSHFTFRNQEEGVVIGDPEYNEYNWPWVISEDETYLYASNKNIHGSYAILYADITVKANDVLTFDYKVGSERSCDILYVMLDGVIIKEFSGNFADNWHTVQAYVFKDFEAGEHELAFAFIKDSDKTANDDVIYIKDLRLQTVEDLDSTEVNANVFRYAATEKNTDPNATTQFKNYVDVYLNEEDEYYHVGSVDGPVLYANMLGATPWNETSVWLLAYYDYIVGGGMNYHSAIESFAWEASQVTTVNGYTPVTEDLKYLLDVAVRYVTYGQRWNGEYHDKEWLELCIYYEHYGQTELPEDPMAGITFTAAIPMQEGANEVNIPYAINPRGFKYKFVPERSGAYHVYSTGSSDAVVFLIASDRTTQLGEWDNKVFVEVSKDENGVDVADGNFEFYWYFEEGKTYYLLFTTYLDQTATYNVNIDWLGETYTYLENAAVGPYSANLNTFELFIPNAIEYAYSDPAEGGDGYYHHLKENGELGGIIYLDVNRPTAFFTSTSLYNICRNALNYEETKRALYIDGVDYTSTFQSICFKAMMQTGDRKGFAAVDQELFELLCILTRSAKYDGIHNSWLMLCYYEKTLGPSNN